jgi:hypothetical protein
MEEAVAIGQEILMVVSKATIVTMMIITNTKIAAVDTEAGSATAKSTQKQPIADGNNVAAVTKTITTMSGDIQVAADKVSAAGSTTAANIQRLQNAAGKIVVVEEDARAVMMKITVTITNTAKKDVVGMATPKVMRKLLSAAGKTAAADRAVAAA